MKKFSMHRKNNAKEIEIPDMSTVENEMERLGLNPENADKVDEEDTADSSASSDSIVNYDSVEDEMHRIEYRRKYLHTLWTTFCVIIIAAAIAVLIATMFTPVLQVSGKSMEPTLSDNDIIILFKEAELKTGDVCGFYYQNKLLLKRVIGTPGDVIDIDEEGNVSVNGKVLDEPYLTTKSLGECDVTFPCQVPDNRYFVMGDNRDVSIDSRSSTVGYIEKEQIVGKVILRIYPKLSIIG